MLKDTSSKQYYICTYIKPTNKIRDRAVKEAHGLQGGKNKWQPVKMKWGVWQNSINWLILGLKTKRFGIISVQENKHVDRFSLQEDKPNIGLAF